MKKNKKTFISNQELELTQKIQLLFPRGFIPREILTYWENCPPDILRIVLKDAFYFLENVNSPIIKVRRPIPFRFPHNENSDGRFYFSNNSDQSETGLYFDIRDVQMLNAGKPFRQTILNPTELLSFLENENIVETQLDIFQLWAIYLRGYDFFKDWFYGIVYAVRSAFVVNNDIYLPGISFDTQKKGLKITWYSSWNNFSENDFILSID
jgi:hypothetical protein